eukprot:TRINITY_DN1867_c0_g1_i1.p1 TRINITY_DN1867_c0_g1~~TRINITY_DN1867_c0_g1_i1.p1  ORF type:complete len:286 (+),score=83.63 TRINITY_DN1867_c0_g1_i1:26-883(+)
MPARDLTEAFSSCVRLVAERKGVAPPQTLVIKKRRSPSSPIGQHAQAVLDSIRECQATIVARAGKYLYRNGGMSNQEKDQSDVNIAQILKSVNRGIKELEDATDNQDGSDVMKHHRGQVHVVQAAAQQAFKVFHDQKTFRKRQTQQLAAARSKPASLSQDLADGTAQVAARDGGENSGPVAGQQLLEDENASLLREMQCVNSQVQDIQQKMIEIAEMSAIFRTNIIQQSATIDGILDLTEQSTDHMLKGNENLEDATKDGFSFRLMMVVFLLVASACILFLDWYQ